MNIKPKKYDLDPLANFMGDVMEQLKSLTIMKEKLHIGDLTISPPDSTGDIEIEIGDIEMEQGYRWLYIDKTEAKQIIEYLQQQIS